MYYELVVNLLVIPVVKTLFAGSVVKGLFVRIGIRVLYYGALQTVYPSIHMDDMLVSKFLENVACSSVVPG